MLLRYLKNGCVAVSMMSRCRAQSCRDMPARLLDRGGLLRVKRTTVSQAAQTIPDFITPSRPPSPGPGSATAMPLSARPGGSPRQAAPARPQQDQQQQQQRLPLPAPDGSNRSWQSVVALAAAAIVVCYADRSNMSTAILPMAEHFGWDKAYQGVVLSAFFGGYAATQVLGGRLADSYGGKAVLTAGVAFWSLFTCLTPLAAAQGTVSLLTARVLLGLGEGVAFPAIHSIVARNVPAERRSTAVAVITAASYVGTALAFGCSPLIITHLGWPWIFYLFGGAACLWLPFWLPAHVQKDMPRQPPAAAAAAAGAGGTRGQLPADEEEQPLLLSGSGKGRGTAAAAAGDVEAGDASSSSSSRAVAATGGAKPWGADSSSSATASSSSSSAGVGLRALLTQREVWAICVCQYCQSYGMYGLLTWLPTFFSDYYKVQLADLGGYTLLPYLVQGVVGAASGALADQMLSQGWSVRQVRVVLQVTGMLGPAACLMAAVSPIVGGSAEVASGLITLGLGLSALTLGAVSVNHLDIAPRHAGQVFGLGNTAATLSGLVSVPLTGLLLERTDSWVLVFGLIGVHFVVGSGVWAAWVGDKPLPQDGAAGRASLPA